MNENNNRMDEIPQNINRSREPTTPFSELDFQMKSIDPTWGKEYTEEIDTATSKRYGLLAYFTRDLRLANLKDSEVVYCKYYLDLAGDLLKKGFPEAFQAALSRVATVLELSQSRGGFLRKRLGTITSEVNRTENVPKTKKLWGGRREQ